ncbi:MAG: hemerythrin domain-containing protein, partial [Phycisphaerae bacterium]|nr:hemerythrin domain-containing protein [Phycisphaerae bacterium]
MQARGPLMVEHRLIERMIAVVRNALDRIRSNSEVAPQLVEAVVDFIRVYADRTHHGKEEDVLFRELDTRSLSAEDRRVMEELLREHVIGREITQALSEAGERHR